MSTQTKKILLVDTDQFIIRTLTSKLQSGEITVDSVDQSWTAIEKLAKDSFDLIVLEIVIPLFSGYAVLDFLKQSENNKQTPVLILTNLQQEDDIKRTFEYDIFDYSIKYNVDLIAFVKKAQDIITEQIQKPSLEEKTDLANKIIALSQQNNAVSEPKIKILKCSKCEATLPPKTEFCPYCGTKVEEKTIIKQNY